MVHITDHARERMDKYSISENDVILALVQPDRTVEGYMKRSVAEKSLNGYILRVIYEEHDDKELVITVYKAKKERYWGNSNGN